jgi:FAD/FMN-containing dehydrogenase/Fe-S oxidoreductase
MQSKPLNTPDTLVDLALLAKKMRGDLHWDSLNRTLYATDASAYQEMPLAVAFPKNEEDLRLLIDFANQHQVGLIPRTAGTSLAGQVVGSGIVVDVSRHWTKILEINSEEQWVRVQPGVIRDELNQALRSHGLLFGPETSTANRAMVGGMLGNNSCGSNSIVYGSTRDHTLSISGLLSDGSKAVFAPISIDQIQTKIAAAPDSLEAKIYNQVIELLTPPETQQRIRDEFPKPEIDRRNTGYAVDLLIDSEPLNSGSVQPFDFCKLLAGSEGTLFFTTEIKLNCVPLPPPVAGLQCAHFDSIDDALKATLTAVKHQPYAVELIDRLIIEGAMRNREQRSNASFIEGEPAAVLITELRGDTEDQVLAKAAKLESELKSQNLGNSFPLLFGEDTKKVWKLRKAGLGIVANIPGDTKPVAVIEDTAVAVPDLPDFIREFNEILKTEFGFECVHYAHVGSGEIHLRPVINLKTTQGNRQFRQVASRIASLVKKFRGSLSGEHGDGRLRGEFLPQMIGEENYRLIKQIKSIWDPQGIFNPNKIVDTPPMNTGLRHWPDQPLADVETVFDFSQEQGLQRAAELCSGSGDCRKTELTGGTMCPSYMATKDEADSTRGRANMLRHVLTDNADAKNPLDNQQLKDVMDLCLSCKGCKSECPSNVDVGKMKAEFLQAYQDIHGVSTRSKRIAGFAQQMKLAAKLPWLYNALVGNSVTGNLIKRFLGFATERPLPKLAKTTLRKWHRKHRLHANAGLRGSVYLFCDEFTNFNDVAVGIAAVETLEQLGWAVEIPNHAESGRAAMSKGLLRMARRFAETNVEKLSGLVSDEKPLIGIEPSAILSFRDEYPVLVRPQFRDRAKGLAKNVLMIDEFFQQQVEAGLIQKDQFTTASNSAQSQIIRLHGHCHQKALSWLKPTIQMLQTVPGNRVRVIPSGCCGMAGSFGYESEHYELSMQIGELVLFPTLRKENESSLIAAPGTSCRHQIFDGTGRKALHPIEIIRRCLR